MTTLQRSFALALVGAAIGTSSGCSIIDRLFLLNADGPYAHQAQHVGGRSQAGACRSGECEDGSCPPGACQECEGGACHPSHAGRYGGLAKHHLSPAEKAALGGSNYGAIGPAGPPTGAVAYPYYTTRGPRDFLAKRPPSIGPQ
jgi:hypothetical protein